MVSEGQFESEVFYTTDRSEQNNDDFAFSN